jgi:mercuric ion transport protein
MTANSPSLRPASARGALLAGGVAAILASACCLGPLVLLILGVSGAWIGNLKALEPYRPIFIVIAATALVVAGRTIWRPQAACAPGEVCAVPQARRVQKVLFVVVVALVLIAIAFPFVAAWFY